ncbi:Sel1 repeat family protein [Cotonvirus japonicus]|uniref:Sel1 repeat family protein n=1 Tax=Cotonvirus japonicus TaxID=2811091 RepID=A0ABM7NTX1_9VIRU|nr:Sel1 repeat family protein [Cotonvirus japonicus]BCS83623.1 Sel1 repeat family protein [Cotonvirus japonicus]
MNVDKKYMYDELDIKILIHLANKNDFKAQQELVLKHFNHGKNPVIKKLTDPFNWINILDKCYEDQKFIFFILDFWIDTKNDDFFKQLIPHIKSCAKSGDAIAQNNLGYVYLKGITVEKNDRKKMKWYERSALQGFSYGQYNLARELICESNSDLDIDKILTLLELSANQNCPIAQYELGNLYKNGKLIEPDRLKSLFWYGRAIKNKHVNSHYTLGNIYKTGIFNNSDNIICDHDKAIDLYTYAANNELGISQYQLAKMYKYGFGVERDYSKTIYWLTKSSENNYNDAYNSLGFMYQYGQGIIKDIAYAVTLYTASKSRQYLLKVFEINTITILPNMCSQFEDFGIENLNLQESQLLNICQSLYIQNKYTMTDDSVNLRVNLCEDLEKIILKFINWRNSFNSSDQMINCLKFRCDNYAIDINQHQEQTSITPFVKQYTIRNKDYITFGQFDIEATDKIMKLFDGVEFKNIVQELLDNYYDQLKNQFHNLDNILSSIKLVESLCSKFKIYCELLIDEIEHGLYHRNVKFMEYYNYVFE